jgi:DNA-directed RNA polymerase specialized sigma24 family protein
VTRLHPAFRMVVELRVFQGLSLKDTANSLRISLSATKSRYFRARKYLVSIGSAPPSLRRMSEKR